MKNRRVRVGVFAATVAGGLLLLGNSFAQAPAKKNAKNGASASPSADSQPITYVKASNARKDAQFGSSMAFSADGNTLAIGAINDSSGAKGINGNQADHSAVNAGAVYVYARVRGKWAQQAYVKASNTDAGDQFGYSVTLSADGNTMAVGAYFEDSAATGVNGNQGDNSMENSGAVYVFTRSGSVWTQQAYVKASNTGEKEDGDQFGFAVGLSGDGNTLAVTAVSEDSAASGINGDQADNSADGAGATYVFTRTGSTWAQQAYVKPWNTTGRGNLFGYAVGLSSDGNVMAVGSYNEDGNKGAVYVFLRNQGNWTQQTRLAALNAERGDSLGCAVAISDDGNTIAAGAFDEDALLKGIQPLNAGNNDEAADASVGAAYIFVRTGNVWTEQAYIKATNAKENDQFGWALALSRDGNTVAVGAHLEDSGATGLNGNQNDASAPDSGAAYVYTRTGTTWASTAYVKPSNVKPGAEFGLSLALAINADGKTLAVGAPKENSGATGINGKQDDASAKDAGAAYIYDF